MRRAGASSLAGGVGRLPRLRNKYHKAIAATRGRSLSISSDLNENPVGGLEFGVQVFKEAVRGERQADP